MFGTHTAREITLNIMGDAGASNTVKMIARVATVLIVVNPITKFGLTMNPVALMVEELVMPENDADDDQGFVAHSGYSSDSDDDETGGGGRRSAASCKRFLCSKLIRMVLTGACVATAVSLPYFAAVVGFIGAFCSCFVSLVFPVAAALVLLRHEMGTAELCAASVLTVLGLVACVWGTVAVFMAGGG